MCRAECSGRQTEHIFVISQRTQASTCDSKLKKKKITNSVKKIDLADTFFDGPRLTLRGIWLLEYLYMVETWIWTGVYSLKSESRIFIWARSLTLSMIRDFGDF